MLNFFGCCVKSDEKTRDISEFQIEQRTEKSLQKSEVPISDKEKDKLNSFSSQIAYSSFTFGRPPYSAGVNISKVYQTINKSESKLDDPFEKSETIILQTPEFHENFVTESKKIPKIYANASIHEDILVKLSKPNNPDPSIIKAENRIKKGTMSNRSQEISNEKIKKIDYIIYLIQKLSDEMLFCIKAKQIGTIKGISFFYLLL